MHREIDGACAFSCCPDRRVKRLARQLVGLDLLAALGVADKIVNGKRKPRVSKSQSTNGIKL
jgi:hypothetical protein